MAASMPNDKPAFVAYPTVFSLELFSEGVDMGGVVELRASTCS